MISVSRAGWNARPPDSATPLNWAKVSLFIVHYSGANRDQSVRSIQDYCMDVKGHSDIDYNRIVRGDYDYMGRGDSVGGHTLNHNSISYGVCVIGQDGDATNADKRTVREIYDQVCARIGRSLVMTDHQSTLGVNYTDCPGSELHSWVAAGMPYPEEGEVEQTEALIKPTGASRSVGDMYADVQNLRNAIIGDGAVALGPDGNPILGYPKENSALWNMQNMATIVQQNSGTVDPAQIKTAVKEALLDPEVAAVIAKAVNDDNAERMQTK